MEHRAFAHTPDNRSNWKRIFCWWWGHEYWIVRGLLVRDEVLTCLRCYCATPVNPPCCRQEAPDDRR